MNVDIRPWKWPGKGSQREKSKIKNINNETDKVKILLTLLPSYHAAWRHIPEERATTLLSCETQTMITHPEHNTEC
jgi:hypothetical protein